MSLQDALATLESTDAGLATARATAKDAKVARDDAWHALVRAALDSDTPAIAEAAKGIDYCETEIDHAVNGTLDANDEVATAGIRQVKASIKLLAEAMREAARSDGDVKGAEADLAAAEEQLGELAGTLKDLRGALKEHERTLLGLVKSAF